MNEYEVIPRFNLEGELSMSAGKHANGAKSKKDHARPERKSNGVATSFKPEGMRVGTVVETRGTGRSRRKSSATKKDVTRVGTVVETRGVKSGAGKKPASRDRIRDGS